MLQLDTGRAPSLHGRYPASSLLRTHPTPDPARPDGYGFPPGAQGTTPAGRAVKQDRTRRVQLAIDAMDDDLREVVILYFFQGLSRGEVSEAIGLTLSGTKARLAKATRVLRQKLRALDDSSL